MMIGGVEIRERRVCSVVDGECLAPAGYRVGNAGYFEGTRSCRGTCTICGEPVCSKCSRVTRSSKGKRKRSRICNSCWELHVEGRDRLKKATPPLDPLTAADRRGRARE